MSDRDKLTLVVQLPPLDTWAPDPWWDEPELSDALDAYLEATAS